MFDGLTQKFQGIFQRVAGKSKMSEKNVSEAVHEVRQALIEADVNHAVVKALIDKIKPKAMGKKVIRSITPGQQFIKIVHEELTQFLGGDEPKLIVNRKPGVIMVCGLQGAGKTTFVAKLGKHLVKQGRWQKPLLVACDLQRPAAIDQLQTLGGQINVEVFAKPELKDPVKVAREAMAYAKANGNDVLLFDTAGRLHLDDNLMTELAAIKAEVNPEEVLFVANASQGQDAVNVAKEFHQKVSITGNVLTMLDGTTRGGAALSIKHVTGRPLKYEGVGEKVDDIQVFNPQSMADRVLGMGDAINLVRRAQEQMDEDEIEAMEDRVKNATFTYEDLLKQLQMVKKMGSLKSLVGMLPGMSGLNAADLDEKKFYHMEAIIQSMTKRERKGIDELDMSRRKRIARGSGTDLDEVNRLVKMYSKAKEFFKKAGASPKKMKKMLGGNKLWR